MIKKLKIITTVIALAVCGAGGLAQLSASAAPALPAYVANDFHGDACKGLTQLDSTQDCSSNGADVKSIVGKVVSILSLIIGAVAVIMIIISGFKFVTSSGDAAKVGSAKSTLIYALIGIAIAALAQFLVHYAINTAINDTGATCPSNPSILASSPKCH